MTINKIIIITPNIQNQYILLTIRYHINKSFAMSKSIIFWCYLQFFV